MFLFEIYFSEALALAILGKQSMRDFGRLAPGSSSPVKVSRLERSPCAGLRGVRYGWVDAVCCREPWFPPE
jgi:hypothetical protein